MMENYNIKDDPKLVEVIGTLDWALSAMLLLSEHPGKLTPENLQTLKHHLEDTIGASKKALERLESFLDDREVQTLIGAVKGAQNLERQVKAAAVGEVLLELGIMFDKEGDLQRKDAIERAMEAAQAICDKYNGG